MGRFITLTGVVPGTDRPKVDVVDPLLPTQGALLLVEPGHPSQPWAAGVPADATLLPNLAGAQALSALGATDALIVKPKMNKPAAFTGSAGLVERSSKGGVHAISPQGGNAVAESGPAISFPTEIVKYLINHADHDVYFSMWFRLTRLALTGQSDVMAGIVVAGQQTNGGFAVITAPTAAGSPPGHRPVAGSPVGGLLGVQHTPNDGSLVPHFSAVASAAFTAFDNGGTNTWKMYPDIAPPVLPGYNAVLGTKMGGGVNFGPTVRTPCVDSAGSVANALLNPVGASGYKNNAPSFVFYRTYLEDLTLSGRTYAQVSAADLALYNAAFGAGGRYAGDTFTDPATLP